MFILTTPANETRHLPTRERFVGRDKTVLERLRAVGWEKNSAGTAAHPIKKIGGRGAREVETPAAEGEGGVHRRKDIRAEDRWWPSAAVTVLWRHPGSDRSDERSVIIFRNPGCAGL